MSDITVQKPRLSPRDQHVTQTQLVQHQPLPDGFAQYPRMDMARIARLAIWQLVEATTSGQAEASACGNRVASVGRSGENGHSARVARDRRAVRPSIDCGADVAGMETTLQDSGFRVVFGPKSPRQQELPKVVMQAAVALEGGASND